MHLSTLTFLLTPFLGGVIAAPAASSHPYALKERHAVPNGWTSVSRASGNELINLKIGLKQKNQHLLEEHVVAVSNPTHPRYGQYLSASEVKDLIAPSDDTIDLVQTWLAEHDIFTTTLSSTKDWISVVLPVGKVEELLDATYSEYRHTDGSTLVRAPEWSLPVHLHEHIDVIQPTTSFFRLSKRATDFKPEAGDISWHGENWWKGPYPNPPTSGGLCNITAVCNVTGTNLAGATVTATTLECLRCLYGTINYVPKVPEQNMIGVTNYLNETQKRSDIQLYLEKFRPEAAGVAYEFPIIVVADGQDDQGPYTTEQIEDAHNLEGDLDGEVVLGISWPTKFMSWVTGGSPPFIVDLNTPTDTNEPYLTWLEYVLAQETLPQVISSSYGDDEQTVPYSYAKRACDGFMQLGARGITVLFSSGDSGVGANGTCYSNTNTSKAMFVPDFPASCPWVTAVGGTQGFEPETAVSRFGSGAGFSNYFGMPAYQTGAVEGYLGKIGSLYAGLYNRSGRAYPDVAAQGNHDVIVWAGNITTIGGTSASSPTFAAVITLVNDALIAAGKPPLGFLNPWLYGGAYKALTDITSGSSIGCDTSGFPAEVGWDAVTGFGTPNFGKLVAAAFHK
ncbi:hypothetical protein MBLNU459_g5537t1 [Dothideomycetes sp. NU459]